MRSFRSMTMSMVLLGLLALPVLAQSPGSPGPAPASPTPSLLSLPGLSLVAVGDSIPFNSPDDCPDCTGFVDLYADAVGAATGREVTVRNLSQHNGLQVDGLRQELRSDALRMGALSAADVIVVSIATNDVPWNISDDACDGPSEEVSWSKYTEACIAAEVARLTPKYEEVFQRIVTLREGKPTILRALGRYNDWIGWPGEAVPPEAVAATVAVVAAWQDMVCRAAEASGFLCADLATRFNGPDGTEPSGGLLADDYTHPSDKGNEAIAEVLIDLGFAPLVE